MENETVIAAPDTGAAAPPAAPEPAAATTVDPFENAEVQQFDRAYVQKLREEAAGHRTSAKAAKEAAEKYSSAFGGWDPSDAEVLMDVLALAAKDPKEGAKAMQQIASYLAGDIQETATPTSDAPSASVITQEDLDRVLESKLTEREQKIRLEAAVEDVTKEAVSLGYEPGSADYFKLLWLTKEKHSFDMQAAHKAMEAEAEAKFQVYLAKKAAMADADAGVGPEGGFVPSAANPIKTIADASERTRARLAALKGR